ncbi:hypothetical protein [Streptomyces sp. NPDC001833]|uniref:ArsR/SmtB family transcription factor n=1 Tax=Streptomyces sp. NPDC001833 TaxID=3154658 RepID=UPI00331DD1BC
MFRSLGVPPADVRFGRHTCPRRADPGRGRPRIEHPATALDFSLSRPGPPWLLAVTAGEKAGGDVGRVAELRDLETRPAAPGPVTRLPGGSGPWWPFRPPASIATTRRRCGLASVASVSTNSSPLGGGAFIATPSTCQEISRALLQVHLKKLEAAGLVSAQLEISPDGKAMKFYEVTRFSVHLTPEAIAAVVPELTDVDTTRGDGEGTVR